jgi:YD repeat-containing protein
VFGVGNNWSCSFRAFVGNSSGAPGLLFLHRGGAGYIYYTNDVTQARDGSILTAITNGYQIAYADGSTDLFQFPFVNGSGDQIYFLSSRSDPAGNALTFNYQTNGGVLQLTSVSDPDSPQPTTLHYENSTFANRITRVVDPFGRTAILQYDANGYLTNIVDVATNSSSLAYDPAGTGWITTLTTPYGATSFRYGGVDSNSSTFYTVGNVVNRFVDVTLPTLGHYLYLYRQDCSGFMPQTYANWLVPTNVPAGSTLDNLDQWNRNSFHWDPWQYEHLSTDDPTQLNSSDVLIGALSHWLMDPNTGGATAALSLEQAPSPNGATPGQLTWYDYAGKTGGDNQPGLLDLPSLVARVMPDDSSWCQSF